MSRFTRISLALVVLFALLLAGASSPTSTALGRVVRTASMHDRRADHTSTLLPDGRVLISGGMVENGVFLNSAEFSILSKGSSSPLQACNRGVLDTAQRCCRTARF